MASQASTVAFIAEQVASAGAIAARKMFGEYAIFCDGKMVALICGDQLFVKPTGAGRAHIGEPAEAPPYKGAKPYFLVAGDQWDDREWMATLFRVSAAELPLPDKSKRKSASRKKGQK